jgi:ATP-dependent protease ClpP protease subunit
MRKSLESGNSLSSYLSDDKSCTVYRHCVIKKLSLASKIEIDYETYRYDVYLNDKINDASCYAGLCNILRHAEALDSFKFFLANFGGKVHGLIHLLSAVSDTKAVVEMEVTAPCYSAGSTLALCGNTLTLYPDTFLMFHNYSTGAHGKGQELIDGILQTDAWVKSYMKRLHQPFLTKDECQRIENDKDVYVKWNNKDLQTRIKRHFK